MRTALCTLLYSTLLFASGLNAAAERPAQDSAREKLLLLMSGEWVSRGIYVASKLNIADHLQEGPKSVETLAQATQTNPDSLYRLLHLLAGFEVFEEVSPRVFANTQTSSLLAKAHPDTLHALSVFYGEDIHRSWDELLPSVQTGTPAFEIKHHQPVFAYFKENPLRGALFQQSMKEKSMAVIKSAIASYDFSRFKSVYDIGGGYGQFMQALLHKHPHLSGMLFELPEVVETIQKRSDFKESKNLKVTSGDFFSSIPQGADAYVLKSVLHDWNDEQCEQILKNCRQAMNPSSRLLIIEVVLQPGNLSLYANCMDLLMMAITGGKERTLESFRQMLHRSGLVLENVYPTSTEFSILEAKAL